MIYSFNILYLAICLISLREWVEERFPQGFNLEKVDINTKKTTKEGCKSIAWVLRYKIINDSVQLQLKPAGNIKDGKNKYKNYASYWWKCRKISVFKQEPHDRHWGENWNSQYIFSSLFTGKFSPRLLHVLPQFAMRRWQPGGGSNRLETAQKSWFSRNLWRVLGLTWECWCGDCAAVCHLSKLSWGNKTGKCCPAFVMDGFLSKAVHWSACADPQRSWFNTMIKFL